MVMMEKNVQSMDNAGNVTKDGQQNVDEEVGIATTLQEDTDWGNEDGEDDLNDVGTGESHCSGFG
jgi:hypothetical protein